MIIALERWSCPASNAASVRGLIPVITGLVPCIIQTYERDIRSDVGIAQALEWLHENPDEKPTAAQRLHYIENKQSVQQA